MAQPVCLVPSPSPRRAGTIRPWSRSTARGASPMSVANGIGEQAYPELVSNDPDGFWELWDGEPKAQAGDRLPTQPRHVRARPCPSPADRPGPVRGQGQRRSRSVRRTQLLHPGRAGASGGAGTGTTGRTGPSRAVRFAAAPRGRGSVAFYRRLRRGRQAGCLPSARRRRDLAAPPQRADADPLGPAGGRNGRRGNLRRGHRGAGRSPRRHGRLGRSVCPGGDPHPTRGATSVANSSSVSDSLASTWTTKYWMPMASIAR